MPDIDLLAALHQHFGYPAFRPGQAEAPAHVMAGRNVLVVMPMLANCWKADSCSKMNMAIYYPKA